MSYDGDIELGQCRECLRDATRIADDTDDRDARFCEFHYQIEIEGKLNPKDYKDKCGICMRCHEHTSVVEPCCNAPVWFEGSEYHYEDFAEE